MLTRMFYKFNSFNNSDDLISSISDTKVKYWYGAKDQNSKAKKNFLPPKLQSSFANKQMACVEYDRLSDYEEREVFQVSFF
jgi:hypothetical protein